MLFVQDKDGSIEVTLETPTEGEPCSHHGCLNHITHPCEGCGRIAGRNKTGLNTQRLELTSPPVFGRSGRAFGYSAMGKSCKLRK